jgi:gliding motility-associated-like protein
VKILRLIGLSFLIFSRICAQTSDNIDFERGDFTNWKGYRGYCCGGSMYYSGIKNGWHTLMKTNGSDTNTNNDISFIPGTNIFQQYGNEYSVRLGNPNASGQAERLTYTFQVNQGNALLTYLYAAILQDPPEHSNNDRPKLQIRILTSAGNPINLPCGDYTVTAKPNTPEWKNKGDIYYKNWTTVSVDLRAYIGQALTLEFTTQDCGGMGHFGYAYIDAYTQPFSFDIGSFCDFFTDSIILTAPWGFNKYLWHPGNQTTQRITIKNPVAGDTFWVEINNEAGCSFTMEKIIQYLPPPVVKVCNDTTICLGTEVRLWAHAPGNNVGYRWWRNDYYYHYFKHIDTFISDNPTTTSNYIVQTYNANGCAGPLSRDTVKVTVDRHLYLDLGPSKKVCPGSLVNLASMVKASDYLWTTQPVTSPYFSKDSAISYKANKGIQFYLNVKDGMCSYSDSISISIENPNIAIDFCEHDSVNTITAPLATSYYWLQTGDTTQSINVYHPKNNANYTVIMTGASGCFDTLFYTFYKHSNPVAWAMPDVTVCYGKGVALYGGGSDFCSWRSDPPGVHSDSFYNEFVPDITKRCFISVTNRYGCKSDSEASVLITVKKDAYFQLNKVPYFGCFGDSILIKSDSTKGIFNWTSKYPFGFHSNDTFIKVKLVEPIIYVLTHYLNGCTYADERKIELYLRPDVKIVDYCDHDSEIVIVPKNKYSDFLWLPSHDTTNFLKIKLPSALKKVWLRYTMQGYCSDTQEYILNNIPDPKIYSLADTTICIGASINLYAKGSKSYNHFYWYNEQNQLISTQMKPLVTPGLKSKYKVKVTNEIDCYGPQSLDSFTVTQDTSVISELGNDTFICKGKQVRLAPVKGKGLCTWSSDPPGFKNLYNPYVYVTPKSTTRYILQMKNSKCTGNLSDIIVNVWELPYADAGDDKKICSDSEVTLSVSYRPTYTYKWWSNRTSFISNLHNIKVQPESNTIYYVAVTDTNGCINKDTIKITSQATPVIKFKDLIEVCENTTYQLNAYNPYCTYLWSTGQTSPSILVKQPGIYSVVVSNNGCTKYGQTEIEWIYKKDTLIIPNIFTPNNDGVNEVLKVITNNFQYYDFRIYNRWGQQIFISADPDYSWDGIIQGKPASEGVYFYLLEIKSNCEEFKSYKGTITLIR